MLSTNQKIPDQRRFWEKWNASARNPEHLNQWSLRRAEVILQFIKSINLESPEIMDFGCGTGWLSERLAKFGSVTGVDLAESAIATARARSPHCTFFAGNIFEIPLPLQHFDVVVSQEVLAQVTDQFTYIELAASMLKPAGYLILTTPNKFVIDRSDVFPPQPPEHIENWLTSRQLKNLLRQHFRILRFTSILPMGHKGVLRLVNSTKINSVLASFISSRRIERWKEQAGFGYIFILLAQKKSGENVPI